MKIKLYPIYLAFLLVVVLTGARCDDSNLPQNGPNLADSKAPLELKDFFPEKLKESQGTG